MSKIGELILRKLSRDPSSLGFLDNCYEQRYTDINIYMRSLEDTFPNIKKVITGRSIIDIGCSTGLESIALALLGAKEVIGIDTRIDIEQANYNRDNLAPQKLINYYVMDAHQTRFPSNHFDAVVSIYSLEHFTNPYEVLKECRRILRNDGLMYLTSGVWASPYGAHMQSFTKIPWVHFLFSEKTIMNVRSLYLNDGATRYSDVEGGLNRIGVREFGQYIDSLNLKVEYFSLKPVVKGLTYFTRIPIINEFITTCIIAILSK